MGALAAITPAGPRARTYLVAGCRLATALGAVELAAFAADGAAEPPRPPRSPGDSATAAAVGRRTFAGAGWLGGRDRAVACRRLDGGYLLEVEGVGALEARRDGAIVARSLTAGAPPELVGETVAGPALVLLLAMRGVFCLHAAAAALGGDGAGGGRAVAFAGPSGAGKSTLAAHLDAAGGGWRRIADDVLPVALPAAGPEAPAAAAALPRFPQLKLGADRQPAGEGALPLAAVCLLEPLEPEAEVSVAPLAGRRAVLALAGHTVGARLFAPPELAAHLELCAGLASLVPVLELRVPRRPEALAAVELALRARLGEDRAEEGAATPSVRDRISGGQH